MLRRSLTGYSEHDDAQCWNGASPKIQRHHMNHIAVSGHGDVYAAWLLSRWLWHQIGWWSIPVTGAAAGIVAWVRTYFERR